MMVMEENKIAEESSNIHLHETQERPYEGEDSNAPTEIRNGSAIEHRVATTQLNINSE